MSGEAKVHPVLVDLDEPFPTELPVASDIVLKVKTACERGCNLSGRLVTLMNGDEPVIASVHEEFAVNVPTELGAYSWTLVFPRQEVGGILHERASLPIAFATRPVATSLAVWDVPSPVVTGDRLKVKVGAKSSIASPLIGAAVEFLSDSGAVVGGGRLGDTPWEGTTALFWTEVELTAPADEGIARWTARFAGADTGLAHGGSVAEFSFAVVSPPQHRLTIRLSEKDTEKPIENAHIRLGPFRALTDAAGVAELRMPKGSYEVKVWHAGYEAGPARVDITDDTQLELLGVAVPEENPSARFMM